MIKSLHFAVALTVLLSGAALAHDALDGGEGAKITVVYDHELPNVPGKSMKGVLVEYAPGGFSEGHTHPVSSSFTLPFSKARSAVRLMTVPSRFIRRVKAFRNCQATAMV